MRLDLDLGDGAGYNMIKKMSTHFLKPYLQMDLEHWGRGGIQGEKGSKKMSTHFLNLINGWIWSIGVWAGPNPYGDRCLCKAVERLCLQLVFSQ